MQHVSVCFKICMCIYVCVCIYKHIYRHTYIYTHIYTLTHTLFDLQLYKTSVLTTLLLVFYSLWILEIVHIFGNANKCKFLTLCRFKKRNLYKPISLQCIVFLFFLKITFHSSWVVLFQFSDALVHWRYTVCKLIYFFPPPCSAWCNIYVISSE